MTSWLILLGGLIVWTIHFFGLYAIAEIAAHRPAILLLTGLCLGADFWLLIRLVRAPPRDAFAAWRRSVAIAGTGLSLLAIVWQALPALLA